jgi:hypothetical protein
MDEALHRTRNECGLERCIADQRRLADAQVHGRLAWVRGLALPIDASTRSLFFARWVPNIASDVQMYYLMLVVWRRVIQRKIGRK